MHWRRLRVAVCGTALFPTGSLRDMLFPPLFTFVLLMLDGYPFGEARRISTSCFYTPSAETRRADTRRPTQRLRKTGLVYSSGFDLGSSVDALLVMTEWHY